jgi:AraC family transcriptional regulator, regulatory protein of adaptative response / methylated-DNA-[protein]-cysteine methyltransferase
MPPEPEMRRAFFAKDASYDGLFVTGVSTTGIFCRPSCTARKPRPENVRFFPGVREAMFAGFRPCRRCDPLRANGQEPDWVQRLLAQMDRAPDHRVRDRDLRALGLQPWQVRRYFSHRYNMTFHAFARARRLAGALDQLRRGAKLDEVVMDTGFESHSGFRDAFTRTFGDAPGRARQDDCIVVGWVESPLGPLLTGATRDGVCLLEFTDRRKLETQIETMKRRFKCAVVPGDNAYLEQLRHELDAYFAGQLTSFTVPLVAPGTPFQEKVWSALLQIPYGQTLSYEDLAKKVGAPAAQRAVGTANGMNRIAIVIPCHRVVNKNGKLGGYGGLLWRKEALLHLERGLPFDRQPGATIDRHS